MNNNNNMPDITNQPKPHKSKGKASHPDQIKSLNKGRKDQEKIIKMMCQTIYRLMMIMIF